MTHSGDLQFRAFISYSHADASRASWLHRAVESYRVPARLVGQVTEVGPVPRRLAPIFKDREELAAAGDLSREIEQALLSSEFLIVIASPAAASSRWVNEEIRVFKQHRGEDRVLVVIVAGEPGAGASTDPTVAASECFPEALRFKVGSDGKISDVPAEPVAADLRPEGDGERVGKLKIIAGLTGLKLDDLVQREAQRRSRRLTAIAAVASVLAVVMSTLTVVAIKARNEAERQRSEADGLVEYMLTDLRSKLEPVGRLDVLDSVGDRALQYYSKQDPGSLDADALGHRARALLLVGEVANLQGDLETALATYKQAAATTAEQLRRDPNNGQRIFDHAQSVYWIGYVAWQRGDIPTARQYFGQYLQYSERLDKLEHPKPEWEGELSNAHSALGVLELDDGRLPRALDYFEKAQLASERLREKSADKREQTYLIAQSLAWKADVRRKMLDASAALVDRTQEVKLYNELLASDPKDSRIKQSLYIAWLRIAELHLEAGDPAKALKFADASFEAVQALQRDDPSNSLWTEIAVKSANVRTEAQMMLADWPDAGKTNQWALQQARQLVSTDASVMEWRADCLMPARWREIAIVQALGDRAAAREKITAFQRDFRVNTNPQSDEERLARVMVHLLSGANWSASGNKALASADFARARDLIASTRITDSRMIAAASYLKDKSGLSALPNGSSMKSEYSLPHLFRT
ncbi:MAG: toll/interleukin-1 receptor domain-containing protein [Porphyrobacter sp.]|nr:toll/interleukin-1 receptor domain-containing protein [Porphyrobacter sp.]